MNSKFHAAEKYFFLVVIGINLVPVLSGKFFPTLDGAAHLYNSQLINSLLIDDGATLGMFFGINEEPVPNWTGHIILSLFNSFLPSFIAEKILLLFYLIGLPLAFRRLIDAISPNHKLVSYLVFPFTYSAVLYLGFYNFSIAIVFLFVTLNYWIRLENKTISFKNCLTLFTLITLTYFSHIFVFGILVFLIGLYICYEGIVQLITDFKKVKLILINSLRSSGLLLISSLLPLLLFYLYFSTRSNSGESIYLDPSLLVEWIKEVRPTIALNETIEKVYTKKIFLALLVLTIIALFLRIYRVVSAQKSTANFRTIIKTGLNRTDFWLLASVVMLLLYFYLPDSNGSAGYVSVRLVLLFFLFYILWLSSQKFPIWIGILSIGIALYCSFGLNHYYLSATKSLTIVAQDCINASKYIKPNTVVLPLNYSDNWLHGHFSNYLGVDKPIVILENYESDTGYFPIIWKDASIPRTLLGNTSQTELSCLKWKSNDLNPSHVIDYVFILGNNDTKTDSCSQSIQVILDISYRLVYRSDHCKLYELKND